MKNITYSKYPLSVPSLVIKRGAERWQERLGEKTLSKQREDMEKLYGLAPILDGVVTESVTAGGVPCEWLEFKPGNCGCDPQKIILYIHGGGWVLGSLAVARHAGSLLAVNSGRRVLDVGYRLAPEHPFPAGLEDCASAYLWLLENGSLPGDIALAGDSAGGNLALCLIELLIERKEPLPGAAVLFSPVTDLREGSGLYRDPLPVAYTVYEGNRRDVLDLYTLSANNDPESPLISPITGELGKFPPVLIHVGGGESLAIDCAAFTKKALDAGANVKCKIWRDMFHDFSIFGPVLKESRESLLEAAEFLEELQ